MTVSKAIDMESHLVTPALLTACQAVPAGSPGSALAAVYADSSRLAAMGSGGPAGMIDLAPRLAEMDASGVELSVLSAPLLPSYDLPREDLATLVAAMNDELLAAASGAASGRFACLASLPFPFADACLAELERVADHPLVVGVIAYAAIDGWTPDDAGLDTVYQRIGALGLPVLLHPASSRALKFDALTDWGLESSIGAMFETSTVAARLIFSGVLDRAPDLTLIVPHLGGVLPYLYQRIVDLSGRGDAEHDLSHYLRDRLLYDSCSLHGPALECAVATVPADRIMLGSDYPYRGSVGRAVDHVADSSLSLADRNAILRGTAERFGLTLA